jgi:hypothetical protein
MKERKKEELKRVLMSLATTEKKILNVKECLAAIFNSLQKNESLHDHDRYKGECIMSLNDRFGVVDYLGTRLLRERSCVRFPQRIHTYHSRFIPKGVAGASQIFLRDAHVLPKLLSYEEYCRRDFSWMS